MEGLQTGFKELAIKLFKDRSDRSAPSTFADRYDRLSKRQATEAWFRVAPQRPTFMLEPHGRGKPRFLFPESGYPAEGADESRIVRPYWSTKLLELSTNTRGLAVVLQDTHRSISFGNRKPDVVGYQADKPPCVFHIALVGGVKARRQANNKESFDAYEKGHLESFLEDLLLEFQPYRQAVNGFLTDGCLIQFFRLERRQTSELMWTEGPVLHLHNGGDMWLLGLLQDKDAHGLPADITIGGTPVIMEKLLGIGGSSVVYSGVHQGAEVVVKRFSSMNAFRDRETGEVFLGDWGCATEAKAAKGICFSGALQHAPHRVLRSRIGVSHVTYAPRFSDDLEMVVRSVFHSLSMTTFEEIRLEEDEAKLIGFWERHLAPAIWTAMVAAAQREDYDALKTHIRDLLPSGS